MVPKWKKCKLFLIPRYREVWTRTEVPELVSWSRKNRGFRTKTRTELINQCHPNSKVSCCRSKIWYVNIQSCLLIIFQYQPISLLYSWWSVEQPIRIDWVLNKNHWQFPINKKIIPMFTCAWKLAKQFGYVWSDAFGKWFHMVREVKPMRHYCMIWLTSMDNVMPCHAMLCCTQ